MVGASWRSARRRGGRYHIQDESSEPISSNETGFACARVAVHLEQHWFAVNGRSGGLGGVMESWGDQCVRDLSDAT